MSEIFLVDFFLKIFGKYWGDMLYLILYLGVLLYIGRYGTRVMKQVFVYPFMILLFTVYNPLIMGPVMTLTDWEDRYYRFYWVLPVQILCAYLFAELIERQRNGAAKAAVTGLVICMVLMCGDTMIQKIPDENIYKIDDFVIEISEAIAEEKTREQPIIIADASLYYIIRQYDPAILFAINNHEMNLYHGKNIDEESMEEAYASQSNAACMLAMGIEIDAALANEIFRGRDVDFFVRSIDNYSDEYISSLALSYVRTVDNYEIYRCTHE